MFNPSEKPVETIQELAQIMTFVNEAMAKMAPGERLSQEAMAGLQQIMKQMEVNLEVVGEELTGWRKVAGSVKGEEKLKPRLSNTA